MRILITGGAGQLGSAIANRLHQRGWQVHILDRTPPKQDFEYTLCDITDYNALQAHVHGYDAVVHMAALRSPFTFPGPDVFHINLSGTFNIFEAAAKAGIRRVVQASSINAIGCAWKQTDFVPRYLPLDEDHPTDTDDPYSFSKQMVEQVGDYYWRRDGITSVAFRFPWVYPAAYHKSEAFYERRDPMRQRLDSLLSIPEDVRQQQLSQVRQQVLAYRAERPLEYPETKARPAKLDGIDELLWNAYAFDRYNLWAFIDERDAAQAVEKAITADLEGSHALFVNDDHNWLGYDTRTLAALFFPSMQEWRQEITGSEALVSIQRARDLIDFEPEYPIEGERHD